MAHLARVSEGMDRHDDGMNNAGPDSEPNEAQVTDRVPCREEEEDAKSDIDTENHLKVRRLLRLPGPPARPEAVQHENAQEQEESENPQHPPQEGRGRRRVHRVLRCWRRKRWGVDARAKSSRLNWGAPARPRQ